jgi:uncharacterized protein (TIGR04540 family)
LEVKLFYKTQRELAIAINGIIDAYWEDKVSEELLFRNILEIYKNNPQKIIKENTFTTVMKQQSGKRRLEVVEKILKNNGIFNEKQRVI